MIASNVAKKQKIPMNYNSNTPTFVAVNGVELQIEGTATIKVMNLNNGVEKKFAIIVSPDVSNDILLGYPHLKELGVISKKFPQAFFSITSNINFEKIRNDICTEFPDVICDTLPDRPMDGPPMKINLTPDAKPYKILTAHPIPRHYQKEANTLVSNLLKKGILAKVEGTTDWKAPAFLVPKNKRLDKNAKNNLRFVTE